ncbi:MAG: CDP-glycerol glycerophosphotransferase family protein, partial [Lachnospiraceae bacterium]
MYKNYQMFLVTSPLMEEHFKKQCGLDDDMVIRAGYPCCIANEKAKSYDHDILKLKGLSDDAKIAVYSPTYRDASDKQFFINAIPDMDRLIEVLEEKNILLIFKMHPLMLKDKYYNEAMQKYKDCKNLLFWDNKNDIYEIFSKIDLAIIDYSSIFYDMLASGVKNFIRYMFDIENKNNLRDFVFDVKEMTCGYDCNNFDELLKALKNYEEVVEINNADRDRIFDLFWSYSKDAGNEEIVQAILDFKPHNKDLPTLYSFDIFDTLIKRRTLAPKGIFYYVQDEIMKSDVPFPNMMKTAFVR